jgi:hypothetical protein
VIGRRFGAVAVALGLLLAVAPALLPPVPARASDGFDLTGLQVEEGASWQASTLFHMRWDPDPPGSESVVWWFVHLNGSGSLPAPYQGEVEGQWGGVQFRVPPVPGVYRFEAANLAPHAFGPVVATLLYFDDARPAPVTIEAPAWIAAGGTVPVQLSAPTAPLPISGIDGYAISIDGAADGTPCAAEDRCGPAEMDLPGGIGDTTAAMRAAGEGVAYIHASAVSMSGMSSPTATRAIGVDGTPPEVRLEGVPAGWTDGPVRVTAIAGDPLSGTAVAGPGGPVTAIGVDGAAPSLTPGAAASAIVSGQGVHEVVYWARDAVGNAGDGSSALHQPSAAKVRIDETDPVVHLLASDPDDPERIEATVADALSGPDPDRGSIAVRRIGSSGRFEPLPTVTRRDRLVARWNSDDFPDGPYEFRATGFDAAGNSTATTLAERGAAFVLRNPVKRETRLAFGFGAGQLVIQRCSRDDGSRDCHNTVVRSFARRPAGRTVPCCHGAVIGGRLVDTDGNPQGEQPVEVIETFAAGTREATRRTTLTTNADGRFSAWLAPGPSREVTAEFPGTGRLTRASGRPIHLRVRAAVHLRVSTARVHVGGPPVLFSGRILHPEAPIPVTGLAVQLEFRLPGMPWTEFRTVQSDSFGRFRYPYSFSDDDSAGVRFLFRAFVPATGDWPFAPATSRPIAVTG